MQAPFKPNNMNLGTVGTKVIIELGDQNGQPAMLRMDPGNARWMAEELVRVANSIDPPPANTCGACMNFFASIKQLREHDCVAE